MNSRQRLVLILAALIVVFMLAFPPFVATRGQYRTNEGYHFILASSELPRTAVVNIGTLAMQWIGVGIVAGAAFFAVRD